MGTREMIMGVFHLLLLLVSNLHLSTSASDSAFHKRLPSSADVQEKNVDREMINEKLLTEGRHNVVSINRRSFGGGGGRGGGGGGGGGRGNRGSSWTPRGTHGVIPINAGGASNSHRDNEHRRNAAASPTHGQIGFISLRTGLILAVLIFYF